MKKISKYKKVWRHLLSLLIGVNMLVAPLMDKLWHSNISVLYILLKKKSMKQYHFICCRIQDLITSWCLIEKHISPCCTKQHPLKSQNFRFRDNTANKSHSRLIRRSISHLLKIRKPTWIQKQNWFTTYLSSQWAKSILLLLPDPAVTRYLHNHLSYGYLHLALSPGQPYDSHLIKESHLPGVVNNLRWMESLYCTNMIPGKQQTQNTHMRWWEKWRIVSGYWANMFSYHEQRSKIPKCLDFKM